MSGPRRFRAALLRRSLSRTILLGSALVTGVLVLAFLPELRSLEEVRRADRARDEADVARARLAGVLQHVIDVQTGTRGFVITGNERFLEPSRKARRELPGELARLTRALRRVPGTSRRGRLLVAQVEDYLSHWDSPLARLARKDRRRAARLIGSGAGKRRVDRVRRGSAALTGRINADLKRRSQERDRSQGRAVTFAAGGIAVSLLMVGLLALYLRRAIQRPVRRLTEGARRLEAGRLDCRVSEDVPAEFAGLARSFNAMAASLQSSRAGLESANRELIDARRAADTANRAKSDFLSRMSHELRTPLNSVLGFSQLLQMDALEADQQQYVEHIVRSGTHLLDLINEILDISSIEAGRVSISVEPVPLRPAVEESLAMIAPEAAERDVTLEMDGGSAWEDSVHADNQRLRQVLLNLLSNAIKYNRRGGSVLLGCQRADDDRVRLSVADTGLGIDANRLDRLFEPFDRLGADEGDVPGTGLGLAVSKRLVELMEGRLWADSEAGAGTTFWLELPGARSAQPPSEEPPLPTAMSRSSSDTALVVLYIEDNSANFALVDQALARLRRPVELIPAMQGGLGLELAEQHQPDLILLDLHLPDMTGAEVLTQLKAHPGTSAIPVIVLTADATERQAARLLESGAHAFLTKPLELPRFLAAVEDVVGVAPAGAR